MLAFLLPAPVDHDKDNDVEDDHNAIIINCDDDDDDVNDYGEIGEPPAS